VVRHWRHDFDGSVRSRLNQMRARLRRGIGIRERSRSCKYKAGRIQQDTARQIANYEQTFPWTRSAQSSASATASARIHGLEKVIAGEMLAFPTMFLDWR